MHISQIEPSSYFKLPLAALLPLQTILLTTKTNPSFLKAFLHAIFFINFIQTGLSFEPTQLQSLETNTSSSILSLDMTDDNSMIVGSSYLYTYVYKKDGRDYSLLQRLSDTASYVYCVDITGDGEWLVVSESAGKTLAYKFNETQNKF